MDHQAFLKNPQPRSTWCGPKVSRQQKDGSLNSHWRPFNHGPSVTTLNKTLTIIDSFFNYLVQANYLTGNPLAVDKRQKRRHRNNPQIIDRYLELDEIQATLDALFEYATNNDKNVFQANRARYIILLLFYTGLALVKQRIIPWEILPNEKKIDFTHYRQGKKAARNPNH